LRSTVADNNVTDENKWIDWLVFMICFR